MKKLCDKRGHTIVELMIALALSLIVMSSIYGLLISQNKTYGAQKEILKMQQNARAGIDFLARSVQNTGYNITRGQRFEAASDRYLTVVYDEDNDEVIQNDEVLTYTLSKPYGTTTETFSITPYFDQNGDGQVGVAESRTYNIPLILTGPPYNLYKIIPDNTTANLATIPIAENFDYLLFRYYDQNNNSIPATPIPPYVLSVQQRNDIRRVEIELMARTSKQDQNYSGNGTYPDYSVATYDTSGNARNNMAYNDKFHRIIFTTNVSPRNLILNTWGNLSLRCSPNPVPCPSSSTTITATLVDPFGEPSTGLNINFSANAGTLTTPSIPTNAAGEASTGLLYDWTDLSKTITVSASAVVDVDPGPDVENKTVYNAIAAYFEAGSSPTYFEDFEDGVADGWTEVSGDWKIAANKTYQINSPQANAITIVGCSSWQDYIYESKTYQIGGGQDDYHGLLVRYQDTNHYYTIQIVNDNTHPNPNSRLVIIKRNGSETELVGMDIVYDHNEWYYMKVQTQGTTIKVKYWKAGTTEPTTWMLEATDSTSPYASGYVGLRTNSNNSRFDDISLYPAPE